MFVFRYPVVSGIGQATWERTRKETREEERATEGGEAVDKT
jgi:hypothetical protein